MKTVAENKTQRTNIYIIIVCICSYSASRMRLPITEGTTTPYLCCRCSLSIVHMMAGGVGFSSQLIFFFFTWCTWFSNTVTQIWLQWDLNNELSALCRHRYMLCCHITMQAHARNVCCFPQAEDSSSAGSITEQRTNNTARCKMAAVLLCLSAPSTSHSTDTGHRTGGTLYWLLQTGKLWLFSSSVTP